MQISVRSETVGVPPLQEPDDVWRLQTGLHASGGAEHLYQRIQRQTRRETSVRYGRLQGCCEILSCIALWIYMSHGVEVKTLKLDWTRVF